MMLRHYVPSRSLRSSDHCRLTVSTSKTKTAYCRFSCAVRSGQLLVEVDKPMQSARLLKANVFIEVNIKVNAHRILNTCTWTMTKRDPITCTDDEIFERFKNHSDQCQMNLHLSIRSEETDWHPDTYIFFIPRGSQIRYRQNTWAFSLIHLWPTRWGVPSVKRLDTIKLNVNTRP